MQRLFSTFPEGWPGCGLLLLRIAGAVPLLIAAALPGDFDGSAATPIKLAGAVTGILLLLGLGTPLAAALVVLIDAWLAFSGGTFNLHHATRAVMGLALVMLGPGQYSVDRRLYGRKRIELKR